MKRRNRRELLERVRALKDASALSVFLVLSDHDQTGDGLCWPSIGKIKAITGLSRGTIQSKLNLLQHKKIIYSRSMASHTEGQVSNFYSLGAPVDENNLPHRMRKHYFLLPAKTPMFKQDKSGRWCKISLPVQESSSRREDSAKLMGPVVKNAGRGVVKNAGRKESLRKSERRNQERPPVSQSSQDHKETLLTLHQAKYVEGKSDVENTDHENRRKNFP